MWLKSLLSESGDISAMRFMAILSLLFSFIIAAYGLYCSKDVLALSGMFLGAAFGGKVAQKISEVKP
jgi:hypothetical protein